jgi:hypothetical protein
MLTKAQRPCLVAAVALLSVILTPRSSHGGMINGSFTGASNYSIVYYTDFQISGGVQGSWVPTVLNIEYDTDSLSGSIGLYDQNNNPLQDPFGWDQVTAFFGATSASGDIYGRAGFEQSGTFTAMYQGIAPNGEIIPLPGGGGAYLEASGGFENPLSGMGYSYSVEFFSVPEPPSIVQAFGVLLVVSVFCQLRAVSARRARTATPRNVGL